MTVVAILLAAAAGVLGAGAVLERNGRRRAETQAAELNRRLGELGQASNSASQYDREWLAVLAHELRSPVSAILGYGELLADGTLGPLDERAADAVQRVRQCAEQQLRFIEGIEQMGARHGSSDVAVESVEASELLACAAAEMQAEAASRGTSIIVEDADVVFSTRRDDALRSLLHALGAAIKASPGAALHLSARAGPPAAIIIAGSRLDSRRDDPDTGTHGQLTGAGLRMALARVSARRASGAVTMISRAESTDVQLDLPAL
ncbi:hypothetical protein BH23GEM9_BH23GEM9_27650 [soil metagenome]